MRIIYLITNRQPLYFLSISILFSVVVRHRVSANALEIDVRHFLSSLRVLGSSLTKADVSDDVISEQYYICRKYLGNLRLALDACKASQTAYALEAESFQSSVIGFSSSFQGISQAITAAKEELQQAVALKNNRLLLREALIKVTELPPRHSLESQIECVEKEINMLNQMIARENAILELKQRQAAVLLHNTSLVRQTVGSMSSFLETTLIADSLPIMSSEEVAMHKDATRTPGGPNVIDSVTLSSPSAAEKSVKRKKLSEDTAKHIQPKLNHPTAYSIARLNIDPAEKELLWKYSVGTLKTISPDDIKRDLLSLEITSNQENNIPGVFDQTTSDGKLLSGGEDREVTEQSFGLQDHDSYLQTGREEPEEHEQGDENHEDIGEQSFDDNDDEDRIDDSSDEDGDGERQEKNGDEDKNDHRHDVENNDNDNVEND